MKGYLADIKRVVRPRTLVVLMLISLLTTVLEAASISAVIPAMSVILGDALPPPLAAAMATIGIASTSAQVIALSIAVALIFLLRGLILSGVVYLQSRLVFKTQQRLSTELFMRFMTARFESVTEIASSRLIRTSTTELANLTLGVLLPLATLISEMALISGSLLVLFGIQPQAAIMLLLAALLLTTPIVWINRRLLGHLGQVRHDMEDERVRLAHELVGGIREIKVYDLKAQLDDVITRTTSAYVHVMTRINFLQNFPRIYLETLGVCALLVTCAVQLGIGRSREEVVTFLTVSAFAAFRALPSIAKVLAQWQALRFYRPALTSYLELIERLEQAPELSRTHPVTDGSGPVRSIRIVATQAAYRYSSDAADIFASVDLDLRSGEVVGLTGPSGVGKSTLLDCLIGLRNVTSGDLRLLDVATNEPLQCRVAYVPQTPVIFDSTIGRNITLTRNSTTDSHEHDAEMTEALALSGFDAVMNTRGLSQNSHVVEGGRNLSGGQRQRLALSRALYRHADILVLDEATSALDAESERQIFDNIRHRNAKQLVIMVTHRPELLAYCDVTVRLQPGGCVNVERHPSLSARDGDKCVPTPP